MTTPRYVCPKCGAVDDVRYERGGIKLCGRCDAPLKPGGSALEPMAGVPKPGGGK